MVPLWFMLRGYHIYFQNDQKLKKLGLTHVVIDILDIKEEKYLNLVIKNIQVL